MKLQELKKQIEEFQYFEDTDIIDVSIASIIATRLKLGNPIWLIVIGPSSGGKSQILRPLSLTDTKYMHRIDDLTENTFLSASNQKGQVSLLNRIGKEGIMVISDLTVLFSKSPEVRATILSQFRMIYDGEMIKHSGNNDKPISWKGSLGVLAGSTPSIYRSFEDVADMGERFIYWRMKDYDAEKATRLSMSRKIYGKELDDKLADLYNEYIKEVLVSGNTDIVLDDVVKERILKISLFSERVRTTAHMDWRGENINRIPISAMPMRVALQLTAIAKGLAVMRGPEGLTERDYSIIDWCGYSLANEEKRACLRFLATAEFNVFANTTIVADKIGLDTSVTRNILQNLAAVGVLDRTGDGGGLSWRIKNKDDYEIVRRVENITKTEVLETRETTAEEDEENNEMLNSMMAKF